MSRTLADEFAQDTHTTEPIPFLFKWMRSLESELRKLRRMMLNSSTATDGGGIINVTTANTMMSVDITISGTTLTIAPRDSNVAWLYIAEIGPAEYLWDTLTMDISAWGTSTRWSLFFNLVDDDISVSAVQWTNTTTPGPADVTFIAGMPLLTTDTSFRRVGSVTIDSAGDPIITIPGGDVNWGGPEDGATAGNFPSFADASGQVILDSGYGPDDFALQVVISATEPASPVAKMIWVDTA